MNFLVYALRDIKMAAREGSLGGQKLNFLFRALRMFPYRKKQRIKQNSDWEGDLIFIYNIPGKAALSNALYISDDARI